MLPSKVSGFISSLEKVCSCTFWYINYVWIEYHFPLVSLTICQGDCLRTPENLMQFLAFKFSNNTLIPFGNEFGPKLIPVTHLTLLPSRLKTAFKAMLSGLLLD